MSQQIRVGDILAIPLASDRFAFCRVLKDASIGVYDYCAPSQDLQPAPQTPYAFVVAVYRHVLTSGQWPPVLRQSFENEEDAWPPPTSVRDVISGAVSIYHKGAMRPASEGECEELEPAAVWNQEQILERLAALTLAKDKSGTLGRNRLRSRGGSERS